MPRGQLIALTMPDGSVAVMNFLLEGRAPELPEYAMRTQTPGAGIGWVRVASHAAIDAEIAKTFWSTPKPVSWRLIGANDIPTDRAYRGAWVDNGTAVVHDMPKAREIYRDKVRRARLPLLDELDRQHSRAVGQKLGQEELDTIEAARQRLRDAPADPRIDAAETVEDLKVLFDMEMRS